MTARLLFLFLWVAASAESATRVLVLVDGTRMEVQAYQLQGRVVVFTTLNGKLRSVPVSYVDLEATERANAPPVPASAPTEVSPPAEPTETVAPRAQPTSPPAPALPPSPAAAEVRVSIVYTGRSLGALGVLRDPDEHELLVEQARREGHPLRLAAYRCWRAPNVTLFAPSKDLDSQDLRAFLALPSADADGMEKLSVLRSNNATLLQGPGADRVDLLALARNNPRAPVDFPDLQASAVWVSHGRGARGQPVLVVHEDRRDWPRDPAQWSEGLVNRIEVGEATLYELAVNLGQMGPRATLLSEARARARAGSSHPLLIDLGQREGDLGLERRDRAVVDYEALSLLGYRIVVPYELELALGVTGLQDLQRRFPQIHFLAANVNGKIGGKDLFLDHHLEQIDGAQIGFFGIVDPDLQGLLAKSATADLSFEDPVEAARRETARLRSQGADAVIMLSNLHPRDNALVSREVMGIDAIVADLHVRWSPEELTMEVSLPGRPRTRPGSPALVPRSFANGLGVGVLNLHFRGKTEGGFFLSAVSHELKSVTDRTPADPALVAKVRTMAQGAERPRGEALVPAFEELAEVRPGLADFDPETVHGRRISKRMWEEFLARLLRIRARAEVALIRKLPHFPPAAGELHEAEIRSWLWLEGAIVVLDLSGADLKALLAQDTTDDLRTSGVNRQGYIVHGRPIRDATFYRVATIDLLFDGVRFRQFDRARRVRRHLETGDDGFLQPSGSNSPIPLRDFVLRELEHLRQEGAGKAYLARLAGLLDKDPPFEPLFSFRFDRPTIFMSSNRVSDNRVFGSVPESRATSSNSFVIGTTSRFLLGFDRRRLGADLGVVTGFSRQKLTIPSTGRTISVEPTDDLQVDLRLRRKFGSAGSSTPEPFFGLVLDTEFTPTVNLFTGETNPHQKVIRGEAGILLPPGRSRERLELGLMFEQDLTSGSFEKGVRLAAEFTKSLGSLRGMNYRFRNDFKYFLPAADDDETDLGLACGMVHEILVPLVDELSLSVAADIFFFRGKIPLTERLAASALLRIGISYDRLWKPLYQPFF